MTSTARREADVTVVTVTYNAAHLVTACLDALAAQRLGGIVMDVVVVDNASTDGTPELVTRQFPEVRLIRSTSNLGFAAGNNCAIRATRGRAVILLNNDALPEPDFVATLVRALDDAPDDVAAIAAKVLLAERFRAAGDDDREVVVGPDGRWVADPDGDVRLVNSTGNQMQADGFGSDRGWLANAAEHEPPSSVFGFSGAAAILRRAALDTVGLFDERLFMYYEDTDLSWRMRLAGFRIEYCPGAVVSHIHAASSHEGSEFFRFHDARNRLAVVSKNATAGLAARTIAAYAVTTASVMLRRSQPSSHVWVRLRAGMSFLTMLPAVLRSRRAIAATTAVPRATVEKLLVTPGRASGPYRRAE